MSSESKEKNLKGEKVKIRTVKVNVLMHVINFRTLMWY